jgi:hypothetical protein
MKKIIEFEFNEHLKTTKATMDCIYESVESAAQICIDALKNSRKILIFWQWR